MKDTDLLPSLQQWQDKNSPDFSIGEWIQFYATPELMIGFCSIFWPEFVEVDGCVYFKDVYSEDSVQSWVKTTDGDLNAVQSVMNHRHIYDIFNNDSQESLNINQVKYLANCLVDIWSLKLKRDFPHLKVNVEIFDYDEDDLENSLVSKSVTFWVQK